MKQRLGASVRGVRSRDGRGSCAGSFRRSSAPEQVRTNLIPPACRRSAEYDNGHQASSRSTLRLRDWTRLAAVCLLTVACESDADRAARRADALLRQGEEGYRRLCLTRLSDGYAITYVRLPSRSPVECADCAVWPVVAVPDSAAPWIAHESFATGGVSGNEQPPPPESVPPLDSAEAVRIAESAGGPMTRAHCYIALPRAGGAFVQVLGRASSTRGPTLGGMLIGVDLARRGHAVSTF